MDKVSVAITDFTEAGENLPAVSQSAPVYFVGVNAGHRDSSGSVLANDPPPDDDKMPRVDTSNSGKLALPAVRAASP